MPTTSPGDADEAFSEPEPNVIKSSAGYSVRVLGRTGLEYTERGRTVWRHSEVLAKPRAIAIMPNRPRCGWIPAARAPE